MKVYEYGVVFTPCPSAKLNGLEGDNKLAVLRTYFDEMRDHFEGLLAVNQLTDAVQNISATSAFNTLFITCTNPEAEKVLRSSAHALVVGERKRVITVLMNTDEIVSLSDLAHQ